VAEIQDLDPVDVLNVQRWPENMQYRNVNDAGRADEGIMARWFRDMNASVSASGSSNAFTVTSNRTIATLVNNTWMAFTANHTITGAATLNLNGLGAKPIRRFNGQPLSAGDIISGQPVQVLYKSAADYWFMLNAPAAIVTNAFADFSENASPGEPAANVARLYALDVNTKTMLAYRDSAGLQRLLSGSCLDRAYAQYTTHAQLTTNIPWDDTIPQSNEGTEILTASITPKLATSRVRVLFSCQVSCPSGNPSYAIAALFRDSGADALRAVYTTGRRILGGDAHDFQPILTLAYEDSPATTSQVTYKIRVGANNSNIHLNGNSQSGRIFGGTSAATLILEEIAP
jgi:hypothetical protein